MITLKIDPSNVGQLLGQANEAGIPHEFVQYAPGRQALVLDWQVDGNSRGLRITLHPNGQWSAEYDVP